MTPAEIQRELDELETRLERLRIKYDQYFTGIEKMMPYVQRKDVDRRFQTLHREQMRNTGLRFRFQTLVQRFTSYQTYWGRIIRQIEEGTFKRDVIRAQRLGLGTAAAARARRAEDGDQELGADDLEEVDSLEPLEPEAAPPPPEAALPLPPEEVFREAAAGRPRLPAPPLENAREPSMMAAIPRPDAPSAPAPRVAPPPRPGAGAVPSVPPPTAVPTPPSGAPRAPQPPRPAGPPTPIGGSPVAKPAGFGAPRPVPPTPSASVPAPRPPVTSPPPRPSAPAPGEDPAMRQLYDRYVAARKQTGENADVRYETVARQVRDTLPRLAEKYQGADVRLDVTIKDGKAILRPVVTMKKKPGE